MGKRLYYISLFILLILVTSTSISSQIDRSQVGLNVGDEFFYKITDTFDSNEDAPRIFYILEDDTPVYPDHGEEIGVSILTVPDADTNIAFRITTEDGSSSFRDNSDNYGQPFLFNDWDYWSTSIDEDTKVINEPGLNESVEITNNDNSFGSNHTGFANITSGSSWSYFEYNFDFLYDKETGASEYTFFRIITSFDNGTEDVDEYGFELSRTELVGDDTSEGGGETIGTLILWVLYGAIIYGIIKLIKWGKSKYSSTNGVNSVSNQDQTISSNSTASANVATPQEKTDIPNFCTSCGEPITKVVKFCTSCGSKI